MTSDTTPGPSVSGQPTPEPDVISFEARSNAMAAENARLRQQRNTAAENEAQAIIRAVEAEADLAHARSAGGSYRRQRDAAEERYRRLAGAAETFYAFLLDEIRTALAATAPQTAPAEDKIATEPHREAEITTYEDMAAGRRVYICATHGCGCGTREVKLERRDLNSAAENASQPDVPAVPEQEREPEERREAQAFTRGPACDRDECRTLTRQAAGFADRLREREIGPGWFAGYGEVFRLAIDEIDRLRVALATAERERDEARREAERLRGEVNSALGMLDDPSADANRAIGRARYILRAALGSTPDTPQEA